MADASLCRNWQYPSAPFTKLNRPLAESRVALFTSSGHFVDGDDPEPFGVKGMTQVEAMARIDDFLKLPGYLRKLALLRL